MLEPHLYQSLYADTWSCVYEFFEEREKSGEQWIYRGISNSGWDFQSTLERAIYAFGLDTSGLPKSNPQLMKAQQTVLADGLKALYKGQKPISILKLEGGLVRRFKRQYNLFSSHSPEDENYLEWFALMRHHGAPSRLLDWTYSFFVALYFALEKLETECAVWALNASGLRGRFESVLRKGNRAAYNSWKRDDDMTDYQTFNDIFVRAKPIKLVGGVNPYRRSDRMAAQQGIFLCPGDVTETFEENLSQILRPRSNGNLIKLTIRPSLAAKREMFARLSRMNISRATLFPGLDGFATSLGSLEQPEVMTPDDNWLRYKVGRK